MKNSLEEAKNMFIKYNGSHFFMSREDDYEKYKGYNISKEQELIWINEIQQKNISEIKSGLLDAENIANRFSAILSSLRTHKNIELIPIIVDTIKNLSGRLDSFSKMRISECILETVRSLRFNKDLQNNIIIEDMKVFALDILKDISQNAIVVDPVYLKISHLKDEVKESVIMERIQRSLKEWDK